MTHDILLSYIILSTEYNRCAAIVQETTFIFCKQTITTEVRNKDIFRHIRASLRMRFSIIVALNQLKLVFFHAYLVIYLRFPTANKKHLNTRHSMKIIPYNKTEFYTIVDYFISSFYKIYERFLVIKILRV